MKLHFILIFAIVVLGVLLQPNFVLANEKNEQEQQQSDAILNQQQQDISNKHQLDSNFGQNVFYTVKADIRSCPAPECGGFVIRRVNYEGGDDGIYVSEIYVTNQNINISMITNLKNLEGAQDKRIIVSGQLKPSRSNGSSFQCLYLTDILHEMELPSPDFVSPKFNIKSKKNWYAIKASPFICNQLVTNCPSIIAYKVNSDEMSFINSYTEDYTTRVPFLHREWFVSRLFNENPQLNSLVKGTIVEGKLLISTVYVNTVDPVNPCPQIQTNCLSEYGLVPSFNRNSDRCPEFDTCVTRGPCHLSVPNCPKGYRLFSLASRNKGCPKYWCDAEFLQNPSNLMLFFKK